MPWIMLSSIILLIFVLYVFYRYAGKRQLNRKLQALRSRRLPVTFEELDQHRRLPEGTPNAADLYQDAINSFQEPTEDEKPTLPVLGDAQNPPDGQPYPAEQVQTAEQYLGRNRKSLDLLYEAAKIESCYFQKDYRNFTEKPPLSGIKNTAMLLAIDGFVQNEKKSPDRVIKCADALFRLAKPLTIGPLLIDTLVGNVMLMMGIGELREGMNRHLFSEAQLVQITGSLIALRQAYDMRQFLIGEQCYTIQSVLYPWKVCSSIGLGAWIKFIAEKWAGLLERNTVAMIGAYDILMNAFDVPYRMQLETKENRLQAYLDNLSVFNYKAKELTSIYMESKYSLGNSDSWMNTSAVSICFECMAKIDATIAGIAVERYRLTHQAEFPQSLETLVPDYLDDIPADPFDGRQLKYETSPKGGYAIYTFRDSRRNMAIPEKIEKQYSFSLTN